MRFSSPSGSKSWPKNISRPSEVRQTDVIAFTFLGLVRMPARVARSSLSAPAAKGPRKKNKSAKRSLNAFAIAEAIEPEKHKIRRSRLGQVEDDGPRNKRRRMSDEEREDEDAEPEPKRRAKRPTDDDDMSEESDDEGNRWRMGVVDEDDDSDIDSEEAFGESDEEKFEGWTFRGGSGTSKPKRRQVQQQNEDGEIDMEEPADEESDDESLGSDAVDLATMLDNYESSEEEGSGSGSEDEDDEDKTPPSDYSNSDVEEEEDADRAARLQNLVKSLQPEEKATKKSREADVHESRVPSAAGVTSTEKFDINDFLASTSDPQLKKVSKELGSLPKAPKKAIKLAPSLPKRQKDKLERIAANERAKQTLERWVDTVKQQRRADHLSFPLVDPDSARPDGSAFTTGAQLKPTNDLEAAIQSIMQESGLTSGRNDEEEAKLLEFEELQANKLPIEEVQARRAELRKARDLLFREEVRAKRIKKIKSKAFRRIKRKEREKLAALDRDALAEGMGGEMDEEERENAERRRAEERMRLKHKDSKWAKQMKKSGRTAWDDEAISGVTEMARKSDELRRRIDGKNIRDEDASEDEILSSDDDGPSDEDDDAAEFQQLQRQMNRAEDYGEADAKANRLAGLKFMQQAEARRRQENQEAINQMRKELNGDVDSSDGEEVEETIGRKIFAPNQPMKQSVPKAKEVRGEFEEHDSDAEDEVEVVTEQPKTAADGSAIPTLGNKKSKASVTKSSAAPEPARTNKSKKQESKKSVAKKAQEELHPNEQHSQPDSEGWVTVTYGNSDGENNEQEQADMTAPLDQAEILRRAFAGDDVAAAFEAEKDTTMQEEDDQVIDNTLPGWGSWVGTGLSKRDKKKRAPHANQIQKIEGIRPDKRKDAKLKGVIINQKRNKANGKYLAGELPHMYGTKAEYERSIRMPVGGQWNTSQTYQENVKPRVMVKPGAIVRPMEKPLV